MSDKLIIVIDDERTFKSHEDILYLRTPKDALAYLADWWTVNMNRPMGAPPKWIDALWLDHDLGSEGGDTQDVIPVVSFLYQLSRMGELPIRDIFVHSQNSVGASNLMNFAEEIASGCARRMPLPALVNLG